MTAADIPKHIPGESLILNSESENRNFVDDNTEVLRSSYELYNEPRWSSGEFTPGEESALEVVSGAGNIALSNTTEVITDDSEIETKLSWKDRIRASVAHKKTTLMTSALVTGAVGSWLFEIGPANEKLRADVATELLSQNRGALAAMVAVSGITFGVEAGTGMLTAKTINKKDGTIGKFNRFLFKQTEDMNLEAEDKKGHKKSDVILGLAGGSTPVIIERLRRNPERTYEDSRRTAIAAAAGIAAFSGALTGVAGDLIDWSIQNDYYEQGNATIETLQDWKTWVGLFAALQISPQVKKLASKFSETSKLPGDVEGTEFSGNISADVTEEVTSKRNEKLKLAAKVAAFVGFIAVGGPQEIAELVNDQNITYDVGGWLADSEAVDKAEDYASVLWDWRIYTAGFGALLAGNKLARVANDRKSKLTV